MALLSSHLAFCALLLGAGGQASEQDLASALLACPGPFLLKRIAVSITLRHEDLPARGAARRQQIRERQGRVLGALPPGTFQLGRRFGSLPGFSGWATPGALMALRRNPEVGLVYVDGIVHAMMAEGVPLVGGDHAHARGVTGAGVNVAVMDTGIDATHPDLAGSVVAEQCFCAFPLFPAVGCCPGGATTLSGPGSAADDQEHGTAVSGVITSDGVDAPAGIARRGDRGGEGPEPLGTGRF
jgi:hypothetical protein